MADGVVVGHSYKVKPPRSGCRRQVGDGLIVRFYESQRQRGEVTLTTSFPIARAERVNILEEKQADLSPDGHSVSRDLPAFTVLNDCNKTLSGQDTGEYISTCTTDVRAFHFFGKGQATCFGPVAENIHAANERVDIESVIHVARTYALFLARWCGLAD